MDEHSKLHRVKEVWAEQGATGTWRVATDYAKWRVHGSPAEVVDWAPPTYEEWMGAYADLRPKSSLAHPSVAFSIICPVYNTPPPSCR